MVAGPDVARVIEELQDRNQNWRRQTADTCHHDQTPSVQALFVKDVRSLVGHKGNGQLIRARESGCNKIEHKRDSRFCCCGDFDEYQEDLPRAVRGFHQSAFWAEQKQ